MRDNPGVPGRGTHGRTTMITADPNLRRWAARQLGLGPGASPEEARRAVLAGLDGEGFFPPALRQAACEVICHERDTPVTLLPSDVEEEARLRGEVQRFAARFFTYPPGDRRERWQELADRCAPFAP